MFSICSAKFILYDVIVSKTLFHLILNGTVDVYAHTQRNFIQEAKVTISSYLSVNINFVNNRILCFDNYGRQFFFLDTTGKEMYEKNCFIECVWYNSSGIVYFSQLHKLKRKCILLLYRFTKYFHRHLFFKHNLDSPFNRTN